jgi:hypothetical protein
MLANLREAVDQYKFRPATQRLLPLFEAVANSLQSIHLSKIQNGEIYIDIERDTRQHSMPSGENVVEPIESIKITDNGEGFVDKNFEAFRSLYTPIKKEQFGCKGVGRLIWFKTFDSIKITSIYRASDGIKKREFSQTVNDEFPIGGEPEELKTGKIKTSIQLISAKPDYQHYLKLKVDVIKTEIIQHFFSTLSPFSQLPKNYYTGWLIN